MISSPSLLFVDSHQRLRVRYARFTILLLALLMIGGCSYSAKPERAATTMAQVIQGASDRRQYRALQLNNQLRVLLISDARTDKAAASLDVHIGSAQDPEQFQGLAHFLEHMLFLGTEKYPKAGEYQAYISDHGGNHNAYTSFEHTNYFFDVDADYLEPTLDRFAQFFIAPLFSNDYVEREKNAVHSEYKAKLKQDSRRSQDVFKSIVNPQHPFAKLSVGNLETLAVDDAEQGSLRDQLVNFYQRNYSANAMTLVVVGRESLDQLETMITDKFSLVVDSQLDIADIAAPLFAPGELPLMVQIQPEKNQHSLSVVFPTESAIEFYRHKPLYYLGNILGHEGSGSLLSYLKDRGWAEALSAGAGLSYRGGGSFNISIKLTAAGVSHQEEVLDALFQAINRIRQSQDQSWLFDEQKALAAQQFRYQEFPAPMQYAQGLAANLHYYPVEDWLQGPYLLSDYDQPLITRFLDSLTAANSVITLSTPDAAIDQHSYFYNAGYSVQAMSSQQLQRWTEVGVNTAIVLPAANEFIADDLALKTPLLINSTSGDPLVVDDKPAQLIDREGFKLWYLADQHFGLPKGSVIFSLLTPKASNSAQHRALLNLYSAMARDQLNELSYPAALASLSFSLSPYGRGFTVSINGFSDKQPQLLEKILAVLANPTFNSERFENIKRDQIRKLQNTAKQQPYRLVMNELSELMYSQRWSAQQMLAAYQGLGLQDVRRYAEQLLAQGDIEMLVHGNYVAEQALDFAAMVDKSLALQAQAPLAVDITQLPIGHYSRTVASDYADAAVLLYLQASDRTISRRAALGLSAQWLQAGFYTQLRTEQQLGYIVTSGAYPMLDVPGLFFLVQSPVAGSRSLQQHIDSYINKQQERVADLSQQEFDQQRQALIVRLSERPKNLTEQSERYWQDISQHYAQFDSREQIITALQSLTLAQWQQMFVEDVLAINRRGLWIDSRGHFSDDEVIALPGIDSVTEFKAGLPKYRYRAPSGGVTSDLLSD